MTLRFVVLLQHFEVLTNKPKILKNKLCLM